MTDIYERLADENEPAPATAPIAQLTGDQASELMASLMAEDSDAPRFSPQWPDQAGDGQRETGEERAGTLPCPGLMEFLYRACGDT